MLKNIFTFLVQAGRKEGAVIGKSAIVVVTVDIEADKPGMVRVAGESIINVKTEMFFSAFLLKISQKKQEN